MKPRDAPEIDFYDEMVCELRQPLTAIAGGIQLARRFLQTDPSRVGATLDQVAAQVARMDRMLVTLRERAEDAAHAEALLES